MKINLKKFTELTRAKKQKKSPAVKKPNVLKNAPIVSIFSTVFKRIKINSTLIKPAFITIAVIAIIILGRKSPFGNDAKELLPDSSVFDDLSLEGSIPTVKDDNKYTAFFFEIYDLIKTQYWNVLSDEQLAALTKLALQKVREKEIITTPTNKEQLRNLIIDEMKEMTEEEKKIFITQLSDIVLANLEPFGRSRLYTSKKQQELSNTVKNINPNVNHYDVLTVDKNASQEDIKLAYNSKIAELKTQPQTEDVIKETTKVEKAYEVLQDDNTKKIYDEAGADPTITGRLITPGIYYIYISKFSPTTVAELNSVMEKVDSGNILDTLIIDLRRNIGGAIDGLPYFLGPFIGNDQYAYQFFRRGEKQDFKTKTGWLPSLVRYKKVVILQDEQVQSSGEVFIATLKKYNVGVTVGVPTKGWGSVESVFKITNQLDPENETYSVFLVHSLTLKEDGTTIEGKGVDPLVNTNSPSWTSEFNKYMNFPELTSAVRTLLASPPQP